MEIGVNEQFANCSNLKLYFLTPISMHPEKGRRQEEQADLISVG